MCPRIHSRDELNQNYSQSSWTVNPILLSYQGTHQPSLLLCPVFKDHPLTFFPAGHHPWAFGFLHWLGSPRMNPLVPPQPFSPLRRLYYRRKKQKMQTATDRSPVLCQTLSWPWMCYFHESTCPWERHGDIDLGLSGSKPILILTWRPEMVVL